MTNKKTKKKETSNKKELLSPVDEAKSLFDIGSKHRALKHHDEALVYFQQSLKILVDNNQLTTDLTEQVILMVGDEYDAMANAQQENLQYRVDSLKAMQSIFPDSHPATAVQLARSLNNIGNQLLVTKKNGEALNYFSHALTMLKSKFPFGSHPYTKPIKDNLTNTCAAICDIGNAHLSLNKYAEGLDCFNTSILALEKAFPEGHPLIQLCRDTTLKILTKLHEIGTELLKANKLENALRIFVVISDVMLQNVAKPAATSLPPLTNLKLES